MSILGANWLCSNHGIPFPGQEWTCTDWSKHSHGRQSAPSKSGMSNLGQKWSFSILRIPNLGQDWSCSNRRKHSVARQSTLSIRRIPFLGTNWSCPHPRITNLGANWTCSQHPHNQSWPRKVMLPPKNTHSWPRLVIPRFTFNNYVYWLSFNFSKIIKNTRKT